MHSGTHGEPKGKRSDARAMYVRLAAMIVLSFIWMYVAMYAMVNVVADVYPNVNNAYMAALMAGPMVLFELAVMREMYRSRPWNIGAAVLAVAIVAGSFLSIRAQTGVGDGEFLRSMIPHHSAAILMCREASVEDPEIKELCANIVASQQREIDQMRTILDRQARR